MKSIMRKLLVIVSLVSIVLSSPIISMAAENEVIEKEGENLLVNGDCSQGMTGWTALEGSWGFHQDHVVVQPSFVPAPAASAILYQDVSIKDIPVGTEIKLSANIWCYPDSPIDVGNLVLEFLDNDKEKILLAKSVYHTNGEWTTESVSIPVPEGAQYARVRLHSIRNSGELLDTYYTNINLRTITYETKNELKVVMETKESLQLSVEDDLDENVNMTWTSSDESVASVDTNGVVTALKKGNATITVKGKDGKYTNKIHILVVDDAKDLRLAIDMKAGTKRRVTIDDLTDTKKVTWNSVDSEIATIDAKGKITAVSKGLVLITATDENGDIIGTVYVRVRN